MIGLSTLTVFLLSLLVASTASFPTMTNDDEEGRLAAGSLGRAKKNSFPDPMSRQILVNKRNNNGKFKRPQRAAAGKLRSAAHNKGFKSSVMASSSMSSSWPPASFDSTLFSQPMQPRSNFYAMCDEGTCFVFGGVGSSGVAMNDFYVRFNFWNEPFSQFLPYVTTTTPSPRSGGQMVALGGIQFMDGNRYAFLYGGTLVDRSISSEAYFFYYDVYTGEYNWITAGYSEGVQPVALTSFATVFLSTAVPASVTDTPETVVVLLFFGATNGDGLTNAVQRVSLDPVNNVVTGFDEVEIMNSDNVAPRSDSCCVFSPVTNSTVCFGGFDGSGPVGDTLLLQHVNDSHLQWDVTWSSSVVSARIGPQCTYYADSDMAIFYGGMSDFNTPVSDGNVYGYSFADATWNIVGTIDSTINSVAGFGYMSSYTFVNENNTAQGNYLLLLGGLSDNGPTSLFTMTQSPSWSASSPPLITPNVTQPNIFSPESRMFHNMNSLGDFVVVAFGHNTVPLDSVYVLSSSNEWNVVDSSASASAPSARYGACSCTVGSSVYFFGGFLDIGRTQLSNELWVLNLDVTTEEDSNHTISGTWNLVGTDTTHGGRAFHSCFFQERYLFFIGGAVGSATSYSSSIIAFDIRLQVFVPVVMTGEVTAVARAGAMLYFNGVSAYLYGGVTNTPTGRKILDDLVVFTATLPTKSGGRFLTAQFSSMSSFPYPMPRAFAGVVGTGQNMVVCGGSTAVSSQMTLTSPDGSACFIIFLGAAPPTLTPYEAYGTNGLDSLWYSTAGVGIAGTYNTNAFGFFGGSVASNQVSLADVFSGTLVIYTFQDICNSSYATEGGAISNCWACPPGSNPDSSCSPVAPGSFSAVPGTVSQCPAGRSSALPGATSLDACILCPMGTFSANSGSASCTPCPTGTYCPVGSTTSSTTETQNLTTQKSQPSAMDPGQTPPQVFIIAAVVVIILLIVLGIVLVLARGAHFRQKSRYFNDAALAKLKDIYASQKRAHFGVDIEAFERCMHDLGLKHVSRDLLTRILAEHDQDGCSHLTLSSFLDAVMCLIDMKIMHPFPGTDVYLTPEYSVGRVEAFLAEFNLKSFDAYDTSHALGIEGEAIKIQSTAAGGVVRIVFYVLALGVALALVGQFVFSNIVETRATVPSVAFDGAFSAQRIQILVQAVGVPSGFASDCLTASAVTLTTGLPDNATTTSGSSYSENVCTVSFECDNCALDFDSDFSIAVTFGGEIYATSIFFQIVSTTGIEGTTSSTSQMVFPQTKGQVFRGRPATTFAATLLPTMFRTVDNVVRQNPISSTGFHTMVGGVTAGNPVDSSLISQYHSVPVIVNVVVDSNAVDVARLPTTSLIDFISAMLGSIGGVGGVLVSVMQYYDSKKVGRRHDRLREELEEAAREGSGISDHDASSGGSSSSSSTNNTLEMKLVTNQQQ